jgi:menaquinone-dependent protoporphyrinogen oxidase
MSSRILVTYASRAGSTAEVAEAIGEVLARNGMTVDVFPMQDVTDLSIYRAVVAGSAIRKSEWLPEAVRFVQTHRSELAGKPFATFTVCITLAMANSDRYRQAVREWTLPVRALVKPRSEGLFAGKLDFHKLPVTLDTLKLRLTVALGIFPKEDRRDWSAVRAWAESLGPQLLQ